MKRLVGIVFLVSLATAAAASAQSTELAHYAQPHAFDHGSPAVLPVYQQSLTPPSPEYGLLADEHIHDEFYAEGCEACGDMGCPGHDTIRPWDMWVRGEYLMWWSQGSRLPTLVTTATGAGSGILDAADTQVLLGGELFDDERRNGGRFTIGAWLDDTHCSALEGSFFFLDESSTTFETQSLGTPVLARPFFNAQLQTGAVQTIASPGVSTGGIFVSTDTELNGADLVLRRRIDTCGDRRVDFLVGYRYAGLDERLLIRDELTSIDPNSNVPVGTVVGGFDSFEAFNQFHGGQVGLAMDFYRRRWTLGLVGKVALGNMREQVTIGGTTSVVVPGGDATQTVGGLLTQPSNIGGFSRDEFAVVPEGQLNVRYCLTKNLEFNVGYTFIYLSDVVRPADQIDFRVDPRQITDPDNASPLPAFDFVASDFWVQGVNFGFEYRF